MIDLLVEHELQMKELNASIDERAFLLEAMSSKKGSPYQSMRLIPVIVGNDGHQYTLYCASVELKDVWSD